MREKHCPRAQRITHLTYINFGVKVLIISINIVLLDSPTYMHVLVSTCKLESDTKKETLSNNANYFRLFLFESHIYHALLDNDEVEGCI
jgi:hypothetical protein